MSTNDTRTRKPNLRKRLIIMIVAVVVLFALVIGFNTFKGIMIGKYMKSMANPAQTVSTMVAKYQDWQPSVQAFGNVRAVHGADLALDVAGLVKSVDVKSGADVKQGQVLIKLVAADDRAKLAALQANAHLAELTAKRSKKQLAVQAVSRAQYDTAMANLKVAQANVAAQAAQVAKKTLRAPFAGRVGIITANAGQYIKAGDTLATLQQLDPVYVDFTLPQSLLAQLHSGDKVTVTTDVYAGKQFTGKISATDPKVNTDTRNVGVEATLPNPDERLIPGMFTKVAVDRGATQRYLTLPQTAVTYATYGDTVFVVHDGAPPANGNNGKPASAASAAAAHSAQNKGDDTSSTAGKQQHYVTQVTVTTGPTRGDQVAIIDGIKEGDVIVTSGGMKLKNATPVNINNKVQPAFDPDPQPMEQ